VYYKQIHADVVQRSPPSLREYQWYECQGQRLQSVLDESKEGKVSDCDKTLSEKLAVNSPQAYDRTPPRIPQHLSSLMVLDRSATLLRYSTKMHCQCHCISLQGRYICFVICPKQFAVRRCQVALLV